MPGGYYVDAQFTGERALYINGDGNDWPHTVWRSLDELHDESGKPVNGRVVFDKGFEAVDIA